MTTKTGGMSIARLFRTLRKPGMRYETELYGVLLLIILFLVLVNLISLKVVTQVRSVFEDQVYADLMKVARHSVTFLADKPLLISSTNDWRRFVERSYADSIALVETDMRGFGGARGFAGRLTAEQTAILDGGDALPVAPDNDSRQPGYVVLFPFETSDERSFLMRLYKQADRYRFIADITRQNTLFHISGLLAIVLLGFLYLRVTLRPYERMKHAAREAVAIPKKKEVSVDQIVGTFQQMIDELKEKEEILQGLYQKTQRRAERLELFNEYILAGMASGLISCDKDRVITHFNRSAQRLLGIGEQQAVGEHYEEVLTGIPELVDLVSQTFDDRTNRSRSELELQRAGDDPISLGVSTTLISDEQNRLIGVTVIMSDLTEIKKLQKDVAYKERMAALGETAAGLAHELRNSMTAVVGFGKLMTKLAHDNPDVLKAAESIARESSTTEQMLTRFLAFAQPADFCLDMVDVVDVIAQAVESTQGRASAKSVQCEFSCPDTPVQVWADQLAVRQILSNLVANAIDASTPGGSVRVDARPIEDTPFVGIAVSDDGPGIPAEVRQKIFNPFFTTKEDGTGLGLCTVHKFVTGMGGTIELSAPDVPGLTVTVKLPMTADDESGDGYECRKIELSSAHSA